MLGIVTLPFTKKYQITKMKAQNNPTINYESATDFDILEQVKTPYGGMLHCLYSIRFTTKKELTEEQKEKAFMCLNVIAENESNNNKVRAWCYVELAKIYVMTSRLFAKVN